MDAFLAWLTGLIAIVIPGFGVDATPGFSGYVEARYVYAAPASAGPIETITVKESDMVLAGDLLFRLRQDQQLSVLAGANARVEAARANLDNLSTGGREDEVDVARASLAKAQADLSLARDTSARSGKLFAEGLITQARYDQDRNALASAEALVRQLTAQLRVAELPARDAQRVEAEANLAAAEAEAERASYDVADRNVTSPAAGRIERIFYDPGEMVAAGTPVVSIRPEGALKVKFYLPETVRAEFSLGQQVAITCDSCPANLTATLTHFASQPQFTPPVIYSRDERNRLTFLAEATLDGVDLPPGQPVTVERLQ